MSYEGLSDIGWEATLRVISIMISIFSVLYGIGKFFFAIPKEKRRGVTYKNVLCFWEHYICCPNIDLNSNDEIILLRIDNKC